MKYEKPLLFFIILLALFSRLIYCAKYPYLFGSDPYYHHTIIKIMARGGGLVPQTYTLTNFPDGVSISHPWGFYFLGYLPTLLSFDILLSMRIAQIGAGLLQVLLTYLVTKKATNKRIAIITSLLLSVCVAHIYRTSNHYRGDSFALTSFLLGFYIFQLCVESKEHAFAILSSFFFGSSAFFWRGYPLFIVALVATGVFYFFYLQVKKGLDFEMVLLFSYMVLLASATVAVFLHLFNISDFTLAFHAQSIGKTGLGVGFQYVSLALSGLVFLVGCLLLLLQRLKSGFWRASLPTLALLLFLVIFCLFFSELAGTLLSGGGLLIPTISSPRTVSGEFYQTVSELQSPVSFNGKRLEADYLWGVFNFVLLFFPFGLLMFLQEFDERRALLLPWVLISVFLAFASRRFSFLASPMLCLLAGVCLARSVKVLYWRAGWALVLFTIMLSFLSIFSSFTPLLTDELYEALLWAKDNTPEDAVFLSFWDRATFIEGVAGRATYVNSVYQNPQRVSEVNDFFLGNGSLDAEGVDYIMVDKNLVYNLRAMRGGKDYSNVVISHFHMENATTERAVFKSPISSIVLTVANDNGYYAFFEDWGERTLSACLIVRTPKGLHRLMPESDMGFEHFSGGCVYADVGDGLALWASDQALESNLFKLLFLDGLNTTTKMGLVFDNRGAKIYQRS